MAGTIVKKDVKLRKLIITDHLMANALSEPARIRILELLYHEPMSTQKLEQELANSGFKKATTTIRHHLDILKSAGLIEAARMEEVRGAVMKYYAPTLRVIPNGASSVDFEAKNTKLIDNVGQKVFKVLQFIMEDKKFLTNMDSRKCNLCNHNHLREYAAFEVLSLAMARIIQSPNYANIVVGSRADKKETK